jgi:hypothetical protein
MVSSRQARRLELGLKLGLGLGIEVPDNMHSELFFSKVST